MKEHEHQPPSNATVIDIDAAIRKRAGRGMVIDLEESTKEGATENPSSATNMCTLAVSNVSGYEYLDHTADIQLHAWGETMAGALEQLAKSMFGYMTSLDIVDIDEDFSRAVGSNVVAEGHDLQSMVFNFLDEWLFIFHDTHFIVKDMCVSSIDWEK